MRALVVDDEDDVRELAELSLARVGGWDVEVARSGAEAAALAPGGGFDVILLDVMMPGLDGPSTLERLRAEGVATPVVFLTAKVQPADRERLDATGAAGVVTKPFDPMTLASQVAALVGG